MFRERYKPRTTRSHTPRGGSGPAVRVAAPVHGEDEAADDRADAYPPDYQPMGAKGDRFSPHWDTTDI